MMIISELCRATEMTRDTIRYYEKEGLLTKVNRKENGYKDYSNAHIEQLNLIKHAKELGFTLNEIKELATLLFSHRLTLAEMNTFLISKEQQIDKKINQLQAFKKQIKDTLAGNCEYREQLKNLTN